LSYRGPIPHTHRVRAAETLAYPGVCPKAGGVRQDGGVIGYVAVLAAGYVLGTKAGRERYEQLVETYRAVTGHPATRSVIDAGRRKIAERVSPDSTTVNPAIVELTEIELDGP